MLTYCTQSIHLDEATERVHGNRYDREPLQTDDNRIKSQNWSHSVFVVGRLFATQTVHSRLADSLILLQFHLLASAVRVYRSRFQWTSIDSIRAGIDVTHTPSHTITNLRRMQFANKTEMGPNLTKKKQQIAIKSV